MPTPPEKNTGVDWILDVGTQQSRHGNAVETLSRRDKNIGGPCRGPHKNIGDGRRGKRNNRRENVEHSHKHKRKTAAAEHGARRISRHPEPTRVGSASHGMSPKASNKKKSHRKPNAQGSHVARPLETRKVPRWVRVLKALLALTFLLGYLGGVTCLVVLVIQEKAAAGEIEGEGGEACAKVVCPVGTVCVTDPESALQRCTSVNSNKAELFELVLAIVIGVPAAICIPCSCHWLYYHGRPRWRRFCNEHPQLQALVNSSELSSSNARELPLSRSQRATPFLSLLLWISRPWLALRRRTHNPSPGAADSSASSSTSHKKRAEADDSMNDLFAPVRRRKASPSVERHDDDLELLFGNWRPTQASANAAPGGACPEGGGNDADLDAMFATAKDRHHRPKERTRGQGGGSRERQHVHAGMRESKKKRAQAEPSHVSEGLSVLFAAAAKTATQHNGRKQSKSDELLLSARDNSSSSSSNGGGESDEDEEEEEEEEEDDGSQVAEVPDFFAFALSISRNRRRIVMDSSMSVPLQDSPGQHLEPDLDDDDAVLAELESDPLVELFHPPLEKA